MSTIKEPDVNFTKISYGTKLLQVLTPTKSGGVYEPVSSFLWLGTE